MLRRPAVFVLLFIAFCISMCMTNAFYRSSLIWIPLFGVRVEPGRRGGIVRCSHTHYVVASREYRSRIWWFYRVLRRDARRLAGFFTYSPPVWVRFPTSYLSSVPFFCRWLFLRTAVRRCRQQRYLALPYVLVTACFVITLCFPLQNCLLCCIVICHSFYMAGSLLYTHALDSGEIRQAKLAGRALLSQLPD